MNGIRELYDLSRSTTRPTASVPRCPPTRPKNAAGRADRWAVRAIFRHRRCPAALLIALLLAGCDAGARNDDCDMPDSSCPNQERDTTFLWGPVLSGPAPTVPVAAAGLPGRRLPEA